MPRPQWIFGHDCQEYAYAEFDKAMEAVNTGAKYQAYNIPPEDVDHRKLDFRTDKVITHKGQASPIQMPIAMMEENLSGDNLIDVQ